MEINSGVSSMIMYEDESVEVRYGDGGQLELSPCGCEFMLVRPPNPPGHPLLPPERVRQRTRFTISTYKDLMVAALAFRNKYASRPYLPEELNPADHKKPFFSIDSDVQWPELSSCRAELGPGGETIVRSEEGRAALTLSPSGEEFSAKFMCGLSRAQHQHHSAQAFSRDSERSLADDETKDQGFRRNESRSCSPWTKPEEIYRSTTVVQHHSCCSVAPIWSHALSLACHLRAARLHEPEDRQSVNVSDISDVTGRFPLPLALPLTCPAPHRHRWKYKDQGLLTELVKVMWCHGVTYRILGGAVSVIEVSPGDGSVIRSNGVLNTYFTHHKPELSSGQVKEVTYRLDSLPPDVPGQLYSISSVVSRVSRILACYNEAKQSLKLPAAPSCLQEGEKFCKPAVIEENHPVSVEQHVNVAESRSDLVAAELEKIKRFNFLLENNHLLKSERRGADMGVSRAEEVTGEEVNEGCIAEALQRTSKAIQDIDALISAATLT